MVGGSLSHGNLKFKHWSDALGNVLGTSPNFTQTVLRTDVHLSVYSLPASVAKSDLNSDGVHDPIWQNDTDRTPVVWFMGVATAARP